jgi:hypothetical protein
VADNYLDGYAVGRSLDQGATWEGLFQFEQLTGPKNCGNLASVCDGPWQTLRRTLGLSLPDGGTDAGTDAGTEATVDAGTEAGIDGGTNAPPPEHRARSGCTEGPAGEGNSWSLSAMIWVIIAVRFLAIRRRPPS